MKQKERKPGFGPLNGDQTKNKLALILQRRASGGELCALDFIPKSNCSSAR